VKDNFRSAAPLRHGAKARDTGGVIVAKKHSASGSGGARAIGATVTSFRRGAAELGARSVCSTCQDGMGKHQLCFVLPFACG